MGGWPKNCLLGTQGFFWKQTYSMSALKICNSEVQNRGIRIGICFEESHTFIRFTITLEGNEEIKSVWVFFLPQHLYQLLKCIQHHREVGGGLSWDYHIVSLWHQQGFSPLSPIHLSATAAGQWQQRVRLKSFSCTLGGIWNLSPGW